MHIAVMSDEVMTLLDVRQGGRYIDGTLGSAGHAAAILERTGPSGALLGIDRDGEALVRAAGRLATAVGQVRLCHGNHGDVGCLAHAHGFGAVNGILLDLGVSSDQLDTAARGFSFQTDGPLDMRMDTTSGETAAELVARLNVKELAALLKNLGEEPRASQVARAIVKAREKAPLATTAQLAQVVAAALGGRRSGKHPATRTFQALRMAVNDEIGELQRALAQSLDLLAGDGRLVVITFESLTDRIVKKFFAEHVGRMESLQQGGERWRGALPRVAAVTRRAFVATAEEVTRNPRARSAKVRAVRRLRADEEF